MSKTLPSFWTEPVMLFVRKVPGKTQFSSGVRVIVITRDIIFNSISLGGCKTHLDMGLASSSGGFFSFLSGSACTPEAAGPSPGEWLTCSGLVYPSAATPHSKCSRGRRGICTSGRRVSQGLCCPPWGATSGAVCSDVWGPGWDLLSQNATSMPPTACLPTGRSSYVDTNQCSIESQGQEGTQVWPLIPFLPAMPSTGAFLCWKSLGSV